MIARVFPRQTALSPTDDDAYFGPPEVGTPHYSEAHISVTFTWDVYRGYELAEAWKTHADKVIVGGVAVDGESLEPFAPGKYLQYGVTITTRGCPNKCSFCLTNKTFIEFEDFPTGNIVQDNNILASSPAHWRRVTDMLKTQHKIRFTGGLEAARLNDSHIDDLRNLKITELWFACDAANALKPLEKIAPKIACFRSKLRCYVLVGKNRSEENERLRKVWRLGFYPFAQLYRDREDSITYTQEDRQWARVWSRPAIYKAVLKREGLYEAKRRTYR